MEISTVSALTEALVNILLGCCSLAVLSWVLVGVETFISERKHDKREEASAKREEEYHNKRMSDLNK